MRSTGRDLLVIVSVDNGGPSAAEIVAGALQNNERPAAVGTTTFGKGALPTPLPLGDGGALSLAVGRHLAPDGRELAGDGIAPGVRAAGDHETRRDEAVALALDVLGRSIDRAAR